MYIYYLPPYFLKKYLNFCHKIFLFSKKGEKKYFLPAKKPPKPIRKWFFGRFLFIFFAKKNLPNHKGRRGRCYFPAGFPAGFRSLFYRLMIRCLLTHLLLWVVIPIIYTPPLSLAVPRCSNVAPCASMVSSACPKAL